MGLVKAKKWFSTTAVDVAGRGCIPVELKVGGIWVSIACGEQFDESVCVCHFRRLEAQVLHCAVWFVLLYYCTVVQF